MVEDAAPESHVLVAFDVHPHEPLVGVGRERLRQVAGRPASPGEGVERAEFFSNLASHTSQR